MRTAICVILLALLAPALLAEEGLTVEVKPVVEGKATPGEEYTLKLEFTVPEGYHAYHKDNPGYSLPVKVTWKELSGLKLVKETWPEPKKHKDEFSEEWELNGTFHIAYTFSVPADAKDKLTVTGSHETQFCDAEGCLQAESSFETSIDVGPAEEKPSVKIAAEFEGEAIAGGEINLKLTYSFTKGYHLYHKDNPGYGLAPAVEFSGLSGLKLKSEKWPDAKKHEIEPDWIEWEYTESFTVTYTFAVAKDAKEALKLAGKATIQICDENACFDREVKFSADLKVKPAKDEGARIRPRQDGLMGVNTTPPLRMVLQEAGEKPASSVSARLRAPGQPGGKLKMDVIFNLPSGFHAYHRDNEAQGGTGGAPKIEFTELGGLTLSEVEWPEGTLVEYEDAPAELELPQRFTLSYTFDVPADAYGPLIMKAKYMLVICDELCYSDSGEFDVHTHVFHADFDKALARAKQENKPLLVDFNGLNCGPCRRMEASVFLMEEVEKLFEDYVIVSVMNDVGDARYDELWEQYKPSPNAGVPYYAVMDHDAKVVRGIASTLPASKRGHEFVEFLKGPEDATVVDPKPVDPKPVDPKPEVKQPKTSPPVNWPAGLSPRPAELSEVFDFESVFASTELQPGGLVSVELRFKLKEGEGGRYRLYHPDSPHTIIDGKSFSLFRLKVVEFGGLEPAGEWQFPEYHLLPADDPENMFGADEWEYFGDFVVTRKFRLPKDASDGTSFTLIGGLSAQYCDDGTCIWFLDESKTPFGWQATVTASSSGAAAAVSLPRKDGKDSVGPEHKAEDGPLPVKPDNTKAPTPEEPSGGLQSEIDEKGGLFWFLLGVFGLGMVTLLTPCVLPVLPLTIAFFVKQSEQGRSPIAAALIYCSCIVGVFTVFGLITSLALGEQGAQIVSTNPYVNLGIALLFTVFALSFFGLFELRMPTFLSSWISRKQMATQKEGKGYVTALLSGGSFAIISFSCTGPIAATILAGAAGGAGEESMSRWVPVLAMLVYASGLALPIFVMGMFPSLLKKLPKSGGWMNALKVVFAFIELAVAARYFSWAEIGFTGKVIPEWFNRDVVDAFWIASAVAAGLYLLGVFRLPHDHEKVEQVGVIRMLIALCFFSFALYLVPGLTSAKPMGLLDGFMPPRAERPNSGGGAHAGVEEKWYQDLDEAKAVAKETGQPVFIDFTGVICANCRWVEKNIFPAPEVHGKLLNDYVLVQQWTDKDDDPKAKESYAKYGQGKKGVPMYVIIDADGNMLEKYVPPQFINTLTPEEFAAFMDRAMEKFAARQ